MATAEIVQPCLGIRHVLIATDLSHKSDFILGYGLDFARLCGAEAEIAYVLPTEQYAMADADGIVVCRAAARRDLLDLHARLHHRYLDDDDTDHKLTLLEGPVAESLLQQAGHNHTDLIVVGTHGRGGLGKVFLGSVAEKVFRQSPVPVLTIGPNLHAHRPMRELRHILAPCDLTARSHPAVHFACELARGHCSRLTVLHVVEQPSEETKIDPERVKQGIRQNLAEIVGRDGTCVDLHYQVEFGKAPLTTLKVASDSHTDLIVMGVRSSSGMMDRFQWPVAYEVVREASCPVLTLRGPRPSR